MATLSPPAGNRTGSSLEDLCGQLADICPTALTGSVVRAFGHDRSGGEFSGSGRGRLVEIERQTGGPLSAEVIGFRDDLTLVYLLDNVQGVRHGNRVRMVKSSRWLRVGGLLGRIMGVWSLHRRYAATGSGASRAFGTSRFTGNRTPAHRSASVDWYSSD